MTKKIKEGYLTIRERIVEERCDFYLKRSLEGSITEQEYFKEINQYKSALENDKKKFKKRVEEKYMKYRDELRDRKGRKEISRRVSGRPNEPGTYTDKDGKVYEMCIGPGPDGLAEKIGIQN